MTSKHVTFESVLKNDEHIKALYGLLKERNHSISHNELPSFEEHEKFVYSNPYRYWYLIFSGDSVAGSFNVKFDNSIGLNAKYHTYELIGTIIAFIRKNLTPCEASSSLVPPYFYVNVASSNTELQNLLGQMDLSPIQVSFKI